MPAGNRCPWCGGQRPPGELEGLCPRCLLGQGLELGSSSAAGEDPLGGLRPQPAPWDVRGPEIQAEFEKRPSESVLSTLACAIGPVPRILLRDTEQACQTPVVHPSSRELPAPDLVRARYQFLGEIDRGGMGAILKGRDTDLGRDLAVKVLLEKHRDNLGLVRRFVEEAQIGGQLQHPGIVPVYELGCFDDHRPYFTMKLVNGRTLAAMLEARQNLAHDRPRLLSIFEAVCQTMAYAHARGVIHRDLKPGNVIVGSFGEVQVMDWGLAKVLRTGSLSGVATSEHERETIVQTARSDSETHASHAGAVLGTPAYMPPEQARGELDSVDERADVFSLGAILCEVLTGHPPHAGATDAEIRGQAARGDLSAALARLDACDAEPELLALVRAALAPDARNRPRGAGELARAITAYLSGVQDRLRAAELARARAQARTVEERKRRKTQFRMAAVILLVLAAGIGGVANQWSRADANYRKAQTRFDLAREAIERFHTGASEDVLLKEPQLKPLREKLLGSALEFYEKVEALLEKESGGAPLEELASAYERVGAITGEIGSFPAAIESLERARAIRQHLAEQQPRSDDAQAALADVLARQSDFLYEVDRLQEALDGLQQVRSIRQRLAELHSGVASDFIKLARTDVKIGTLLGTKMNRTDSALAAIDRAVAIYDDLIRRDPVSEPPRRGLGEALSMLGTLRYLKGSPAQASEPYERAAAIFDALAAQHPEDLDLRESLALALSNRGNAAMELGHWPDADRYFQRMLAAYEGLVLAQPNVSRFQFNLGHAHQSIASLLARNQRAAEAIAECAKAVQIFDRLAQDHPGVSRYIWRQGQALSSYGDLLRSQGRFDLALETIQRAQQVVDRVARENPSVPHYQKVQAYEQIVAASLLKQMGRRREAIRAYEQVIETHRRLPQTDSVELYNVACAHAVLASLISAEPEISSGDRSLVAQHLDQAVKDLREALRRGYSNNRMLTTDPDLDALRSRAEFRALVPYPAFPADPFAR